MSGAVPPLAFPYPVWTRAQLVRLIQQITGEELEKWRVWEEKVWASDGMIDEREAHRAQGAVMAIRRIRGRLYRKL